MELSARSETPFATNRREALAPPVAARVIVRLFGSFSLAKDDAPVALRAGGKVESLLVSLALRLHDGIEQDELVAALWPAADEGLGRQSLHTLTHTLRRDLGDALDGAAPVIRSGGRLRLNTDRGIEVDVDQFERNVAAGDRLHRAGQDLAAVPCYEAAIGIYAGDLVVGSEIRHLLERERLRSQYLSLLARLAEARFAIEDYRGARNRAVELLTADPCREDAHRLVMRCAVRLGERAQALRQYALCSEILAREFAAEPEPATQDLFDKVRLAPASV